MRVAGHIALRHEHDGVVAHADFVARLQVDRSGQALPVKKGAVLRSDVVNLATLANVNDDGAMTTGDVAVFDHDVVVGQPANRVKADLQRVDGVVVFQVVFDVFGRRAAVRNLKAG